MNDRTPEGHPWRTRYGTANPERVDNALWKAVIEQHTPLPSVHDHCPFKLPDFQLGNAYWLSPYREDIPGPIWFWHRYGRTSTPLPDGRIVHIAGVFEEPYDPNFCIYNDVVVEHPTGRCDIYLYPKTVFPPTDFHTATLIDHEIFLIGSLGYQDLRRIGTTQVLKLDTRTLSITQLSQSGGGPGWVSQHLAEKLDARRILIIGGYVHVQTGDGLERNGRIFELDVVTGHWQEREHGDHRLFPISKADYGRLRNPRPGTGNPEIITNPFWHEMARRGWPPSRARFNFADAVAHKPIPSMDEVLSDQAPDKPEIARFAANSRDAERAELALKRFKVLYPDRDVVWTAERQDAAEVVLDDGRALRIGGMVRDTGDEHADAWIYNDIIVTDRQGNIEILAYPTSVFPRMIQLVCVVKDRYVFIFGILYRIRPREERRSPIVLRLDTSTYEILLVPAKKAPYDIMIYPHSETVDGDLVIFGLGHRGNDDPHQRIAFDMNDLEWSDPLLGTC